MAVHVVADTHPTMGEVLWIWGDKITVADDNRNHRWFHINDSRRHMIGADEVPLSVHHGKWSGLMMPRVLAELNGFQEGYSAGFKE